jgi:coniferyl-aldehyde dehydrogenase
MPLTLELGGKSPVIISQSANMKQTVDRIMFAKTLNSGQICLAPDYIMVPEDQKEAFSDLAMESIRTMFPTLKDNQDYTSIINERHYDRLKSYLTDAKKKGAEIVEINPADENFAQQEHFKIPPTLVMNPSDNMKLMQEEIFGPILPIKTYQTINEAIDYVNAHDRPLGLYYFGADKNEENEVISRTISGGVTINDLLVHATQEGLPFGGVGASGMGVYNGLEGFKNFSHAKPIYRQTPIEKALQMMRPPYTEKLYNLLKSMAN